jgi:phosphatidylserine decarboxylase
MFISEDQKEEIRKKYRDNISEVVLIPISSHSFVSGSIDPFKMIHVGGKSYFIDKNKKFLVNKLSSVIENLFPSVDIPTKRRTVKYYLDLVN